VRLTIEIVSGFLSAELCRLCQMPTRSRWYYNLRESCVSCRPGTFSADGGSCRRCGAGSHSYSGASECFLPEPAVTAGPNLCETTVIPSVELATYPTTPELVDIVGYVDDTMSSAPEPAAETTTSVPQTIADASPLPSKLAPIENPVDTVIFVKQFNVIMGVWPW